MTMPKAAMYEDHAFKARKNKVRGSWKVLSVEPKSISKLVDKSTNGQFGLGVLPVDPPHAFAALCGGKGIGHAYSLVSDPPMHKFRTSYWQDIQKQYEPFS
jgi:hypothetical protein